MKPETRFTRSHSHQITLNSTRWNISKSRANWKLERRVQTLVTRVVLADNVKGIKTGTTYDQWNLELSNEILHFLRQAVGLEGWYVECVNLLLVEVSLIGISSYLDDRFLIRLSIDQVPMSLWAVTELAYNKNVCIKLAKMINCIIFLSNLDFGDMYIVQMIQIKYLSLLKVQQVGLLKL